MSQETLTNSAIEASVSNEVDGFDFSSTPKGKRAYTSTQYREAEFKNLNDLYENYFSKNFDAENPLRSKELEDMEVLRVVIRSVKNGTAVAESRIGQSIIIDVAKEEKAISRLGFPPIAMEIGSILDVVILKDNYGNYNGSVSQGYENSLKSELLKAIKDERSAFLVKIEDLCPGGFMVNLSGIKCFLPGSLAAANRIIDFAAFVGKEIMVMVETYDDKRDIFVVSFKKYLKNIIHTKVEELSFVQKYTGTVTGTSSAGVFVEWDEYYTGLIPAEEFVDFAEKIPYKSGDRAEFYVSDMKNPQRIVLTVKLPDEKTTELQNIKDVSLTDEREHKIYAGTVTKIKNFGLFVKLDNGLTGLIEKEELEKNVKDYVVGETIECNIMEVEMQSARLHLREKYHD
jgi:small subunit ribosomal protein S1